MFHLSKILKTFVVAAQYTWANPKTGPEFGHLAKVVVLIGVDCIVSIIIYLVNEENLFVQTVLEMQNSKDVSQSILEELPNCFRSPYQHSSHLRPWTGCRSPACNLSTIPGSNQAKICKMLNFKCGKLEFVDEDLIASLATSLLELVVLRSV